MQHRIPLALALMALMPRAGHAASPSPSPRPAVAASPSPAPPPVPQPSVAVFPSIPSPGASPEAESEGEPQAKAPDLAQKLDDLSRKVQELQAKVDYLERRLATASTPPVDPRVIEVERRMESLYSQFVTHSHDYLLEVRLPDGSNRFLRADQINGSGGFSTGRVVLTRPTQ